MKTMMMMKDDVLVGKSWDPEVDLEGAVDPSHSQLIGFYYFCCVWYEGEER